MASILYKFLTKSILVSGLAMLSVNFLPEQLFSGLPMEPRHVETIPYKNIEHKWNDNLSNPRNQPEYIQLNSILGPESIAISPSGLYYTGLADGRIVEIDPSNRYKMRQVLKFNTAARCQNLLSTREHECGRFLQLRFVNDTLYAIEANSGLYKIDVRTGTKSKLGPQDVDSRKTKFYNSFAFDPKDTDLVYVSASSTKWDLHRIIWSILDLEASGMILALNLRTGKSVVVVDGLMLPNGVDVDAKRDRLVFAETTAAQVEYVLLKDARKLAKGGAELSSKDRIVKHNLISTLPGNPDNIVIADDVAYIALPFVRVNGPELVDKSSTAPSVRKAVARIIYAIGQGLGYIQDNLYQHPLLDLVSSEMKCGHIFYRLMKTDRSGMIKYDLVSNKMQFYGSENFGFVSEVVPDGKGNLLVGSFRSAFMVKVREEAGNQL